MKRGMVVLTYLLVMVMVITACGSSETASGSSKASLTLLNVSYDPTRELYDKYNKAFIAHWEQKTGQKLEINQSHGGSGKQGRSVIDGLEADVVTLALAYDIDAIEEAGLIEPGWQSEFNLNSSPYTSTIVFLVRKGNPKNILDWDDLIQDGIEVITPNPKTSGGARWNYLAAWGYALKNSNNEEQAAIDYVTKLFKNVSVLDTGARGATTTFVEREIGDVLLAWENEAYLTINELGPDKFDIVYPSISILAEPPVAIVDKIVDKKGTREAATAYLEFLYTEEAQKIVAESYYRPTNENVKAQFIDQFPAIELLQIDHDFGGWKEAQEKHFSEGGVFDQIYVPTNE